MTRLLIASLVLGLAAGPALADSPKPVTAVTAHPTSLKLRGADDAPQLVVTGRRADGRDVDLQPGDFALFDSTRPYSIAFRTEDRFAHIIYQVPRASLDARPAFLLGKKLIDYLLSKETEAKLARSDAAQIPLHSDVEGPPELRPIDKIKTWNVNYAELAAKLQAIQPFLKRWVESGS